MSPGLDNGKFEINVKLSSGAGARVKLIDSRAERRIKKYYYLYRINSKSLLFVIISPSACMRASSADMELLSTER